MTDLKTLKPDEDGLYKLDIYLTKEAFDIIKTVNTKLLTPSHYINQAILPTASQKIFKQMRKEEKKEKKSGEDSSKTEEGN